MKKIKAKIELLEVYGHKIEDNFIISVCQNILNDLQTEEIEGHNKNYEKEKKYLNNQYKKFPGFKGIDPDIWVEVGFIIGDAGKGIAKKAILLDENGHEIMKTNIRFDYMITRLKSFGIKLRKIKASYYEIL
ncbi:MAG: hypothetical protein ACP6IQ_11220 [Candidatus Njordarchaeia archaeon]